MAGNNDEVLEDLLEGIATSPDFLLGLGRTVDALTSLGASPGDLKGDYEAALRMIAPVVQQAASTGGYSRQEYLCVLYAAAALSGRCGLGMELFFPYTPLLPGWNARDVIRT